MSRTASEVLDEEFLVVRAKILELAAFFDRLSEADVSEVNPARLDLIARGCALLNDAEPDKAARVQLLFSREYDRKWREDFDI